MLNQKALKLSYVIGYSIISYIDPNNGAMLKNFFSANPSSVALGPFIGYTDKPNDYKYLVGNRNILFGDGSVSTKVQS